MENMKKFLSGLFILMFCIVASPRLVAGVPTDSVAAFLQRKMEQALSEHGFSAAALAVVTKEEIVHLSGYGFADAQRLTPMDPRKHLVRTGSVSKLFTWIAVLQLYERGLVDLDADIRKYLDIELPHRVRYRTHRNEEITMRHLMTHTAGFEDILEGLFSFSEMPALRDQVLKRVPDRIYPPGTVMAYSNYGTTLAGYIVEVVSGMPFHRYVKEHILSPLGMIRSSFSQPLETHLLRALVEPCRKVEGEFLCGNFEHMPAPAGGQSTTPYDMALFLQAHLRGGSNASGTILKPETMQMMHQTLFRQHSATAGMTHGMKELLIQGHRMITHSGSTTVYDAGFFLMPEKEIGVFISCVGGNNAIVVELMHALIKQLYPGKGSADFKTISDNPIPLKKLAGEYHQSRSIRSGSSKILNLVIGSLHVRQKGENKIAFRLYDADYLYREVAPGVFKSEKENTQYPFGYMENLFVSQSPDGRVMLVTDGPMTFIRARWYETAAFAGWIFLPALLLAVGTILLFFVKKIRRKIRKQSNPATRFMRLTDLFIAIHALCLLLFLVITAAVNEPHPVHLLPESFFTHNPVADFITNLMASLMALSAMAAGILFIMVLRNKKTGKLFFIHRSIYIFWGLALTWLLYFYNLLIF
jgi:CubicO group peptidase (beta-lactamase class C family)